MRTVTFKSVLDGIANKLNITPDLDLSPERATKWCEDINTRLDSDAWRYWDWPELGRTEERAFAPIWKSGNSYTPRKPVFHIPTFSYYQVKAGLGPPIGTLPTNAMYYEPVTIADRFIPLDQDCNQAIGEILGAYNSNPRISAGVRALKYWLSEKGIDLPGAGLTAFIYYRIRPSQFTTTPYNQALEYDAGGLVYSIDEGEVYRARTDVPAGYSPRATGYWAKVPMPERFATYLKLAVAADDADDQVQSAKLEGQAAAYLERQADLVVIQGNSNFYQPLRLRSGTGLRFGWELWGSAPAEGAATAETTTLTDECVDEFGEAEHDFLADETGNAILTNQHEEILV